MSYGMSLGAAEGFQRPVQTTLVTLLRPPCETDSSCTQRSQSPDSHTESSASDSNQSNQANQSEGQPDAVPLV